MAWKTFLDEAGDTERCKPTFQVLPGSEIEKQSHKELVLQEHLDCQIDVRMLDVRQHRSLVTLAPDASMLFPPSSEESS